MSTDALVVGTAGHIDHGKTSLVRALTGGSALDRLPEEQERGITIALGYGSTRLPDGRIAAFVDVPGHERLVRTMVAGATGIDAVILVVSAQEGVMPQTREHLAILGLLGVSRGIVALSMVDLVDEEMIELATDDVQGLVKGTFLADAPVIPTSAVTGRGKEEILAAIAQLPPSARDEAGPFRLPVDRAFVRQGFGTVVTGTAWSGALPDGATVTLLPDGRTARVRGMESHGEAVTRVVAGRRVALNLAGVERDEVPRGTVVVAGELAISSMLDVRYRHLAGAPPLDDGVAVRLLHGTAERLGRLYLAEDADLIEPGPHVAQVRLDEPLPCLPGDRYVIRRVSPVETLGGGDIVDPWAEKLRHKTRVAHGAAVARLAEGDRTVWLEGAGEKGLSPAEAAARGATGGVEVGGRVFAPAIAARLEDLLAGAIAAYHQENPISRGPGRRELRRGRLGDVGEGVFDALVDRLAASGRVAIAGALVTVPGWQVRLTNGQEALRAAVLATIVGCRLDGITPKDLAEKHEDADLSAMLDLLEADGRVERIAGLGWMDRRALEGLHGTLRGWFASHPAITTGEFKDLTDTTRKAAIPLLEWLDKRRWTRRVADTRIAGPELVG
jgi:selenocysteine-specific elongation factor